MDTLRAASSAKGEGTGVGKGDCAKRMVVIIANGRRTRTRFIETAG